MSNKCTKYGCNVIVGINKYNNKPFPRCYSCAHAEKEAEDGVKVNIDVNNNLMH